MNHKVDIVPGIMVLVPMLLKPFLSIFIQLSSSQPTDKTRINRIIISISCLFSQLRKSVNNYPENHIQQYRDNNQEKRQIICKPYIVGLPHSLIIRLCRQKFSHPTAHPQPIINSRQEAVHQTHTD